MRAVVVTLLLLVLALGPVWPAAGGGEPQWLQADVPREWSFPRDHWAHEDFKTEWWYFTGHLTDTTNPMRTFGYQFTFFRIGIAPESPRLDSNWSTRSLMGGLRHPHRRCSRRRR